MNPMVETAARELASKLRAAPPNAAFSRAREAQEADEEAQRLLADLQRRQQALLLKQQDGRAIAPEELSALRALQGEVRRSRTIMAYVEARREAQAFLPTVNLTISELLGFDFGALASSGGR